MEKVMSFDEWLANYVPRDPVYYAEYDPETGTVTGIYPDHSAPDTENKIEIDSQLVTDIFEGKINLSSCVVNKYDSVVEIAEVKSLTKIDDVLHRIVDKKYTEVADPDIFVTYNRSNKKLVFELSEKFKGNRPVEEKYLPIKSRKIHWDGDTLMNFLITDYNDPNNLKHMFSFRISDLIGKSMSYDVDLDKRFSVYTRRLLKKYIFEEV